MKYVNLGSAGLRVSRICLGCMSYGVPERGSHPWSLPEEQSRPFFARALFNDPDVARQGQTTRWASP